LVDGPARIVVIRVERKAVRLGIDAPETTHVMREELTR